MQSVGKAEISVLCLYPRLGSQGPQSEYVHEVQKGGVHMCWVEGDATPPSQFAVLLQVLF